MYAIIDIETTGGSARHEKITEIAIYLHDGEKKTGEYVTLVNPERNIPYFITNLTGISNEMVEDAPKFYEIARDIIEITEKRTIVAHNARFDYSFLREEFRALGYNYKRKLLDTVTLSRKFFPGYRSYSLGNICRDLGIEIIGRHRAAGDAIATARLFEMCMEKDEEMNGKVHGIISNTRISKLHPSLDISKLEDIPEEAGIYYFYDENGKLIYIGKSKNLLSRITTHLSNNTTSRAMEMRDSIADIGWDSTGSELIALIRESFEIKTEKPMYNRAQRRTGFRWGIFSFHDENGYLVFCYRQVRDEESHLALFTSRERARSKLIQLTDSYNLCQKLTGLYETSGACFHSQVGLCRGACTLSETPEEYNIRAGRAVEEFIFAQRNFFIIDQGRNSDERCAVKIINGKYAGYGYFSINEIGFGLSAIHDCIIPSSDNRDIQVILKAYLKANRVEKIIEF